jgi:hypothetical protein
MKKSILLVPLLVALLAALAGCGHPNDITDGVASIASGAQA